MPARGAPGAGTFWPLPGRWSTIWYHICQLTFAALREVAAAAIMTDSVPVRDVLV
jgi:hypothetical protein